MATANHILLQRTTISVSTAGQISFTSLPQTGYTDLKIVASLRGSTNSSPSIYLNINNDSTTTYTMRRVTGGGTGYASDSLSATFFRLDGGANGTNHTANTFTNFEAYIPNYTLSVNKTVSFDSTAEGNATTANSWMAAGLYPVASPVTSVQISLDGSIAAGSSIALYGIADVSKIPAASPKAFGGDIIKTDGTYWYHAFLASGQFTPQVNLTADVLVVAGGGSSGKSYGGGGGGGGYQLLSSQSLASNSYAITVGAGGAAPGAFSPGNNGVNSQFGSLTASVGGGAGGYFSSTTGLPGATGGSGGGGAKTGGAYFYGGAGTSGQGNSGGNADGGATATGAGGGAGSAGGTATSNLGGTAGNGLQGFTAYASTYYGGGGAGAPNGSAGSQGGTAYQTAGAANTGAGGGAEGYAGGSGIVIIRYAA